jgi:ADP-ribosyl-[dinitrogen reductase] hydrolase
MPTPLSCYRGSLIGLATGDALGTTLEFSPPGTFEPITDMIGGGPFNLEPGQWTDDTSMALCLAESLIECGGFNAFDQMERYVRWYREGHLSSRGDCFDIGNTVRAALHEFEQRRSHPTPAGECRRQISSTGRQPGEGRGAYVNPARECGRQRTSHVTHA